MKKIITLSLFALVVVLSWSCNSSDDEYEHRYNGRYSKTFIYQMQGFEEHKDEILEKYDVNVRDFEMWSTSDITNFDKTSQNAIKSVREAVKKPHDETLLQKVISLDEVAVYMENVYDGSIGGFVNAAADVKSLSNMSQIYNGLRLDYEGSKFKEDGAGYAVIRFYSSSADKLTIPYASALGGNPESSWKSPWWGGAGFTTSTLGDGGYPIYFFENYYIPNDGAELYEVTPEGREMLRSVFTDGEWQTYENPDIQEPIVDFKPMKTRSVRNGMYLIEGEMTDIKTQAMYKGHLFTVRGEVNGEMHLTTSVKYDIPEIYTVEQGIWGVIVGVDEVSEIKEIGI